MLGFIVAIIGGLLVAPAEDVLAKPAARILAPVIKVEEAEMRALSLALVLVIVGVLAWILRSGSVFWVAVGLLLGLFGQRLFKTAREAFEKRRS